MISRSSTSGHRCGAPSAFLLGVRASRPQTNHGGLAFEIVRYARAIAPRWIVVENIIQMRSWSRYREFLAALGDAGYRLAEHLLDAADLGVPQRRRRLFLLCDRVAEPPGGMMRVRPARSLRACPEERRMPGSALDSLGTAGAVPSRHRPVRQASRRNRGTVMVRNGFLVPLGETGLGGDTKWATRPPERPAPKGRLSAATYRRQPLRGRGDRPAPPMVSPASGRRGPAMRCPEGPAPSDSAREACDGRFEVRHPTPALFTHDPSRQVQRDPRRRRAERAVLASS